MSTYLLLEILTSILFFSTVFLAYALFKQVHKTRQCLAINKAIREKSQKVVIYDNTTMAYNYTYFVRHANGAIVNTRKNKSSISLLIIDIDQLEEINIKFGFPIGDKTLNIVCDAIKSSIRNDDIVGRFGGSGFFVLLNECDAKGTENVIRKIDNKLGTKQVTGMHDESISFSVKYSSSIARGRLAQLGTLIENAEEATQRIKKEKLFYMITDHNGYPVVLRKKPSLQTA